MKNLKKSLLMLMLFGSVTSKSQVIISLLFGEALNTPKIEFGLTGGWNQSYLLDIEKAEPLNNFNLGFYFHIMLKPNSFISTGVLVKSNVGGTGMPTYPVGSADFDALFADGTRTTKINIFYVPIMFQQRIQTRWLLEAGIQPGLRNKAFDIFETTASSGDLEFKKEIGDEFTRLDFGLVGGAGFKLKKDLKSTSIGVLYYYGLVDMAKDPAIVSKNASLYVYCRIPIGNSPKEK